MLRHLIAAVCAFALAIPAYAAQPLPAPEAVRQTYITFCLPMTIKGADRAEAEEVAAQLGYSPAALSTFPAIHVSTAPAWRVPSSTGVVTLSLGSIDERLPSSCEITVTGVDSALVRTAMEGALICKGCPFTRNAPMSSNTPAARVDKYDWKIKESMLVSVLTVALPDESKGASFFMHVHRLP